MFVVIYNQAKGKAQKKTKGEGKQDKMKETTLAVYERESTLWKNANAFYKAQDWTRMECLFIDYSEDRKEYEELGITVTDKRTNIDITEQYVLENLFDRYTIRLTNKSGKCQKSFSFKTKEEANNLFKEIMRNKILKNFKKSMLTNVL